MWWPTYVSASMTKEELVKNFKDTIGAVAGMFPKSPFEPYAKEGKWMNSSLIYDNTSAEVNAAYNKIIKEFAGKNPKGGDFTKAEIIAEMKKYTARQIFILISNLLPKTVRTNL